MSTNNNTDNILQVKDPGTMGNELLSVPGFVNELKDYTLAVSPRPNPPLAFADALAKFVYGALFSKALENGLLGRCLFVESDEFRRLQEPANRPLPPFCVETAAMMVEKEKRFNETGVLDPVVVTETPEAKAALREVRLHADDLSEKLFAADMRTSAALCCRLYEKAKKLALLYAISENPDAPVMTPDAVRWATAFATHVTKKMLYEAQSNVAEGNFDRLKKRAIGLLARNGGQMEQSALLRSLHIDAGTLKRIVLTLHMSDQIEEERIDRRKVIITLKTAA